jgi:hypothetical protein
VSSSVWQEKLMIAKAQAQRRGMMRPGVMNTAIVKS